eukprot:GHVU01025041.1.p1 GENE.GHVU01025041.1~~GHVU01025041.1.p1  ORF type:complete len:125 (+),score=2.38 GHVU01025041.1:1429-1803(+)
MKGLCLREPRSNSLTHSPCVRACVSDCANDRSATSGSRTGAHEYKQGTRPAMLGRRRRESYTRRTELLLLSLAESQASDPIGGKMMRATMREKTPVREHEHTLAWGLKKKRKRHSRENVAKMGA